MFERQVSIGQDVFGRLFEDRGGAGEAAAEPVRHLTPLRHRRGVVRLGEDRADDGGDGLARAVRDGRQQRAHEVDAAPLPRRARQHGGDRLLQYLVRIRKAVTAASSSAQIRDTSDLEIPSTPSAFTRASTFRVETPWT
jgi:hypothetical protein